jgi:hypothetical protein
MTFDLKLSRTPGKGYWAEHFPKVEDSTQTLCGEKRNPIMLDLNCDNDMEFWCKKCRRIACPDCMGSGIIGGDYVGIYCICSYAYIAMARNGDL